MNELKAFLLQIEKEAGYRLAHALVSQSVLDFIELSDEYSISEVRLPDSWAGKSLVELNVRVKYRLSVIAIRRAGAIIVNFAPNAPLQAGDELVVLGSYRDLADLGQHLHSWTSVLDCRMRRGEYGLELEIVVFPGEKLPKLPSSAKLVVRPWDPKHDTPFFYAPTVKNSDFMWENH